MTGIISLIQKFCTYTARCTYQVRLHLVHMLVLWDKLLLRQYLLVMTCTSDSLNLMMLMMVMTVLITN